MSAAVPRGDRETEHCLVVEQHQPVVGLSTWIAGAVHEAHTTGRQLVLFTPASSRITTALELALAGRSSRWVTHHPDGPRDGVAGTRVTFTDGAYRDVVPDLSGVPAAERTVQALSATGPAPSWWGMPEIDLSGRGPGHLTVVATTLHPVTPQLVLGASATTISTALAGAGPRGWGVAEPLTQPWVPAELTRWARRRTPRSTVVVLGGPVGDPVLGLLTTTRVDTGVRERLQVAVGADHAPPAAVLDQLAADVATGTTVRSMTVFWQPGRRDLTRAAGALPVAVPVGMLLTAPAEIAAVAALSAGPELRVLPAARAGGTAAWVSFGWDDPVAGYTATLAAARGTATP